MSNIRGYVMNLDPAVLTLPYGANIDIRDTVKYKEVMKQFNLGPNGGILTSLKLFATKFDEVKLAYYSLKLLFSIIYIAGYVLVAF
jgi:GTPase SAR1 family protein